MNGIRLLADYYHQIKVSDDQSNHITNNYYPLRITHFLPRNGSSNSCKVTCFLAFVYFFQHVEGNCVKNYNEHSRLTVNM